MPLPVIILGALTWLGRIGLAAFAINEIRNLTAGQQQTIDNSLSEASAAGLSATEQKKMIAAVTYEQIEKEGADPTKFWDGLTPEQRGQLEFSPQSLKESVDRTTFLGTAQTLLWIAAGVAASIATFRGLPATLKGLSSIAKLRTAGGSAQEIANALAVMRTTVLAKTWVPGAAAGILVGGGWLASGLTNNLNDALLWGRIFLDQAHGDVEKAAANAARAAAYGSGGDGTPQGPRTIIRMTQEEKPMQFIGTLFSSKLGSADSFERKIDDEITDLADLREDVKLNLNHWLLTLPGRLGYSVGIRKEPVDEFGAKQSGIWATLTLFITHVSGKTTPVDTILLGPVKPQVRLEIQKKTKTIETEIPGVITAMQVREIMVPRGAVDIFTPDGQRVDLAGAVATPAEITSPQIPAAPAAPTQPAAPAKPVEKYDLSRAVVVTTNEAIQQYKALGWDIRSNPASQSSALAVPPFEQKESAATIKPGGASAPASGASTAPPPTGQPDVSGNVPTQTSTPERAGPAPELPNFGGGDSRQAGETEITARQVTVNVDALMVRSEPRSSAPLAGTQRLVRGDKFIVVAWVRGENVMGEDRWWKSSKGNYVWSGGTKEKP